MMKASLIKHFWIDTKGEVNAGAFLLLVVLVAIGAVVGLQVIRDHIVQEYGDVAVALEELNQSYFYAILIDGEDPIIRFYNDTGPGLTDPPNAPPACIEFVAGGGEGP